MKALKVILGIVFLPITVYILIWKSKMPKKAKIILTVIWSLIVLVAASGSGGSKENAVENPETSEPIVTEVITEVETEDMTEAVTEAVTEIAETEAVAEETKATISNSSEYEFPYGEILDTIETELEDKTIIVVKARIQSQMTNKLTISQNYKNACDWLKKNKDKNCDEFQYWAVAEMQDGSEGKVISFTLNSETISALRYGNIVDIQIPDYAEDLWILPSLQ